MSPARLRRLLAGASLIAIGWPLGAPISPAKAQAVAFGVCENINFPKDLNGPPPTEQQALCGSPRMARALLFWAPTPGCSPGKNPMVASISSNDVDISLHNRTTSTLEVNGNTKANFLVGSAGTKDVLRGGLGGDTYVVGGASSALVARSSAADDVRVISTSGELDEVVLSSGTSYVEVVYIDGTPAAGVAPRQTTPGLLDQGYVASGGVPSPRQRPAYGASALAGRTLDSGCLSQLAAPSPAPFLIASASIAQLSMPMPGATGAPGPEGGPALRVDGKGSLGLTNERVNSPACRKTPCFPGVPALVNIDVRNRDGDRIVLPQEQFTDVLLRGKPITSYQALPLLVVDQIKPTADPKTFSLAGLRPKPPEALVYFSQNGLLVLMLKEQPLGNEIYKGRVIAQLLDGNGRPIVWPGGGGGSILQTSLVSFQPYRPSPPLPLHPAGSPKAVTHGPATR